MGPVKKNMFGFLIILAICFLPGFHSTTHAQTDMRTDDSFGDGGENVGGRPPATWTPEPTFTFTPINTATPLCIHHGDVNFDGAWTAGDAQMAFSIVVGTYVPTTEEACAADCNNNGAVTAGDAQTIFGASLEQGECHDPLIPSTPSPTPAPTVTPAPTGTLEVRVFFDFNYNGTYDAGEGIVDISVTATDGLSQVTDLTTDANGFAVTTILAGDVEVDVDETDPDMPPNVDLTTGSDPSTVTVPVGGTATDTNGYYVP
jgi:hypothetical protein